MLSKVNVNVQPHFVILGRVASTSAACLCVLTQNCALNFGQLQDASLHEVCAREAVKGFFSAIRTNTLWRGRTGLPDRCSPSAKHRRDKK